MDVDAFVARHRADWDRLEQLVAARRLAPDEVDELAALYQRTATHLSRLRSASPDPVLVGRLSTLVARARAAVTGSHDPAWRDVVRFATVVFPAAVHRTARWWVPTALVWVAVATVTGAWVAGDPAVQAAVGTEAEIRQLVEVDFEEYYSANPAASFAFQVWVNNAWVAALSIALGAPTLGAYVVYGVLWQNAANVGVAGGLMAANDRLGLFLGLITPHGLLELTAVLVAAGTGLRLGWTVISPGSRTRADALAQEGRAAAALAMGLAVVLLLSGLVEAFVTPSGLPAWARVGVGVAVEAAFLGYVVVLGGRAVRAGETGDLPAELAGDAAPTTG